jgi:hypothetical protein
VPANALVGAGEGHGEPGGSPPGNARRARRNSEKGPTGKQGFPVGARPRARDAPTSAIVDFIRDRVPVA